VGQRANDRLGPGIDLPVGINKVDCDVESLVRDLGKLSLDARIPRGHIVHLFARHLLPAPNPKLAEVTVAIEDHDRSGRRRGDANAAGHARSLATFSGRVR